MVAAAAVGPERIAVAATVAEIGPATLAQLEKLAGSAMGQEGPVVAVTLAVVGPVPVRQADAKLYQHRPSLALLTPAASGLRIL